MSDTCLNMGNVINDWYGLSNTPFVDSMSNIEENKLKYMNLPPSKKLSLIKIYNFLFKIIPSDDNTITNINKDKFYNLSKIFKYYFPLYAIIFTLLVITDCKPIWKIGESTIVKNIPSRFIYLYLIFLFIIIIMIAYGFYKKIKCYPNIINSIKQLKFKNIYVISFIIAIGMIILNNFILPSIISPIIDATSKKTGFEKEMLEKIVCISVFGLFALLLTILSVIYFNRKRIVPGLSGIIKMDSNFFAIMSNISFYVYLIISLLFVISTIVYFLHGLGSFILNLFLYGTFFFYALIIYFFLYTILEGHNYNKILLFTMFLVIFASIIGFYFLYKTVISLEDSCKEEEVGKETGSVFINLFIPILLTILSIYLYGMVYNNYNWGGERTKFYAFYFIFTIIIVLSWFISSLPSVGMLYSIVWLIISIIQRKYVKLFLIASKDLIKGTFNKIIRRNNT